MLIIKISTHIRLAYPIFYKQKKSKELTTTSKGIANLKSKYNLNNLFLLKRREPNRTKLVVIIVKRTLHKDLFVWTTA